MNKRYNTLTEEGDLIVTWKPIRDLKTNQHIWYGTSCANIMFFDKRTGLFKNRKILNKSQKRIDCRHPHGWYINIDFRYSFSGKRPSQDRFLHRVIASLFCPIPDLFCNQIDHLDGNNLNNMPYNLEWVTQSENVKRAYQLKHKQPVILWAS